MASAKLGKEARMHDVVEYLVKFLLELERLVPNRGTRHMISTTEDGKLEIRIGAGDWYRISEGAIDNPDPIAAARSVALAPSHWDEEIGD
jgi:hypothetical protein